MTSSCGLPGAQSVGDIPPRVAECETRPSTKHETAFRIMRQSLPTPAPAAQTATPPAVPIEIEEPQIYDDLWLGIAVSLLLHLLVALALGVWRYIDEPPEPGLVINSAIAQDQDGRKPLDALPIVAGTDDGKQAESTDEPEAALVDPTSFLQASASVADLPVHAANLAVAGAADGPTRRGAAGGGVRFFGTQGEGRSFVFIVDCSGSMRGRRITRARRELAKAIGKLRPYQKFFVFFYNDTAIPLFDDYSDADLLTATPQWKRRAVHWVKTRPAGGGTAPAEAFHRALAMRPDVVFFLTDGEIPEDSREVARQANRHGAAIHTTGFQSREGELMLRGIARDSGGFYRYVD